MDKILFTINCTTCHARLAVRELSAIGEIIACPKCESMVQIVAPKGWTPPSASGPSAAERPASGAAAEPGQLADTVTDLPRPAPSPPPLPRKPSPPHVPPTDASTEKEKGTFYFSEKKQNVPFFWTYVIGVLSIGVVLAGCWWIVAARQRAAQRAANATIAEDTPESTQEGPGKKAAAERPAPLDPRWWPADSRLVVQVQLGRLAAVPDSERLLALADPVWRHTAGPMLQSLGLTLQSVERLTWTASDLSAWPEPGLFILQLGKDQDARSLAQRGDALPLEIDKIACRRLAQTAWPHPFVVLDEHTIITGREALLRTLADREDETFQSKPLAELIKTTPADPAVSVRCDLAAARAAGWPLPGAWLDVWPSAAKPWHSLWETAAGLALSVPVDEKLHTELALVMAEPAAAVKARAECDALRTAALAAFETRLASLAKPAGPKIDDPYRQWLALCVGALKATKVEHAGPAVTLRTAWDQAPGAMIGPALESRPEMMADWLTAAWAANETRVSRQGQALREHVKAEGRYPPAVAGGALLPPETRLSWIAAMLPYLEHDDWHKQLDFAYPWDGPQNRPVTRRPLPAMVNPAFGPANQAQGYPVTHYVGVAGVGPDAAKLPVGDPRAGVFGYGRATKPEEIRDGTSNTIAILGVTKEWGPWASGGAPTVRALTKAPYVNGPDGFGTGQAHGMTAGMADGSVRFLSKDIDPRVLEQLATINGGETIPPGLFADKPKPGPAAKPAGPPTPQDVMPAPGSKAPPPKPEMVPVEPDAPGKDEPEVDVETHLAATIKAIEFRDMALIEFVRFVGNLARVPVTLDLDALEVLKVRLTDPVSAKLTDTTVRELLEATVAPRRLALVVDKDQVLIGMTPADAQRMRTALVDMSDFVRGDAAATNALIQTVRELVAPGSWQGSGGQGTIGAVNQSLSILQTEAVHLRIDRFLHRLRAARRLPPKPGSDDPRFALAPAWQRAQPLLARPLTITFYAPTPLARILTAMEERGQVKLVVDWAALNAAGISFQAKGTVAVDQQPLSAALEKLLAPLKLGVRAVDADTLEVSTRKDLAARLDLEFYPVVGLLTEGRTAAALIDQIQQQTGKQPWSGAAKLQFDPPSGHLLVLQSPLVHPAVAAFLASQQAKKKP